MATQTLASDRAVPETKFQVGRIALLMALTVTIGTFVGAFTGEKLSFLYKNQLHLTASDVGTLGILLGIPAYLRPFMGGFSDVFPLLGYHRRTYYALAGLLMSAGFFSLSLLPQFTYAAVAGLVLVTGAGGTLVMVMADAVMVQIGNQTGTVGRLQALQQFVPYALTLGGTAHLSGYVSAHWSYHRCFRTAAFCSLLAFPLAFLIAEKRVAGARSEQETDAQRAERAAIKAEERGRTVAALKQAARSPGLWAIVGFVFYLIITPGTNTAQFYYAVDVLHFNPQFIGDLGQYTAAGVVSGIALFSLISSRLPVRAMVWGAFLMDCSIYLLLFGLHDQTSAKVISFAGGIVGIFYTLCLFTLAARACPPGIEGTVYGLVLAAIGLGGTLGEKIGSTIYDAFGPHTHHSILYGWHTLLGFGFGFTVIAFIFIPFLPAWAKSNEPLRPKAETAPGAA